MKAQRKVIAEAQTVEVANAKETKSKESKESKAKVKTAKVVEVIALNKSQEKGFESCTTVSAKIRFLNSEGFGNSAIANFLGKRYQHVRNVLQTPMKRVIKAEKEAEAEKTKAKAKA